MRPACTVCEAKKLAFLCQDCINSQLYDEKKRQLKQQRDDLQQQLETALEKRVRSVQRARRERARQSANGLLLHAIGSKCGRLAIWILVLQAGRQAGTSASVQTAMCRPIHVKLPPFGFVCNACLQSDTPSVPQEVWQQQQLELWRWKQRVQAARSVQAAAEKELKQGRCALPSCACPGVAAGCSCA